MSSGGIDGGNSSSLRGLQLSQKKTSTHVSLNVQDLVAIDEEITIIKGSIVIIQQGKGCNEKFTTLANLLDEFQKINLADNFHDDMIFDYQKVREVILDLKKFIATYSKATAFVRFTSQSSFEKDIVNFISKIDRLLRKVSDKLTLPSSTSRVEILDGIDLIYSEFSTENLKEAGDYISEALVVQHDYMFQYHVYVHLLNHTIHNSTNKHNNYISNMQFIAKEYDLTWNIIDTIYREHSYLSVVKKALIPMHELIDEEKEHVFFTYLSGKKKTNKIPKTISNSNLNVPNTASDFVKRASSAEDHDIITNALSSVDAKVLEIAAKHVEASNIKRQSMMIDATNDLTQTDPIVSASAPPQQGLLSRISTRMLLPVSRKSSGAGDAAGGRLSTNKILKTELELTIESANIKQKKTLENLFVTFLIAQRDLFVRTSENFDEIIESMPSDLVMRVKNKLDCIIKMKIQHLKVSESVDKTKTDGEMLLSALRKQSEEIDVKMRNKIKDDVFSMHEDVFLSSIESANAGSILPGAESLSRLSNRISNARESVGLVAENIQNRQRRYSQRILQFLRFTMPVVDVYDEKLTEISALMVRMSKCGNALSKALYAQKVAFMQQSITAEGIVRIYHDLRILRSVTVAFVKSFSIGNLLYRSSAETLCIELSLCPMSLIMKSLLPGLVKDLQKRKKYVIDIAAAQRINNPDKLKKCEAKLRHLTDRIDSHLQYMKDHKLNENLFIEMLCASVISQFELYTYLATKMNILVDSIKCSRITRQMTAVQHTLDVLNSSVNSHTSAKKIGINSNISKSKSSSIGDAFMKGDVSEHQLSMKSFKSSSFDGKGAINVSMNNQGFRKSGGSKHLVYMTDKLDDITDADQQAMDRRNSGADLYDITLSHSLDSCFAEYYDTCKSNEEAVAKPFVTTKRASLLAGTIRQAGSKDASADVGSRSSSIRMPGGESFNSA